MREIEDSIAVEGVCGLAFGSTGERGSGVHVLDSVVKGLLTKES